MNRHYLTNMPSEWDKIAQIFAALGDETRQKILLLFEPGESISRKTISELLPLSQTAVAHHLTTLVRTGLLIPARHGKEIYYTLDLERLIDALDQVRIYAADMLEKTKELSS
ncbi:MAG: winged helix-turn-helix transcriptional regulator [Deltaproteobacteria bacterium]|nr:winged helix-turn-helix transcriptional regulator [Deltaproteobacteria bacterium]